MGEDHATSSRNTKCCSMLRGRRHIGTTIASFVGTTGNVSEIIEWVSNCACDVNYIVRHTELVVHIHLNYTAFACGVNSLGSFGTR